jgi:uncharacterized delta-60 repeat protein
MQNFKKKLIVGFILVYLAFGIFYYSFNIHYPLENIKSKEVIYPYSSSINPFLAEEFSTFGGSYITIGQNIKLDNSGNIYITGSVRENEGEDLDAFLAKFDSEGNNLWYFIWGGAYDDSGSGIAFDSSGDVYMGGSTASFGPDVPNANWFLAKFDSSGNQIWNYSWGTVEGEWGGSIAVDSSDYIYFIGSTWGHGGPSANVGLIKFNSAGIIEWARYWGIGGYDSPRDLIIDSSDFIYIIAGSDNRGFGGRDTALICYDSDGTLLWDTAWGSTGYDDPRSLKLDSAGNIYIAIQTDSYGAGNYDLMLVKYDNAHTLLWNYSWGGIDSDIPNAMVLDSSDNLYVIGNTDSFGSGNSDIFIIYYNSTGSDKWVKTWGESGIDVGYEITIDSSNNTYITGNTDSFNAINFNALILKCNSTGNELWYKAWDGESHDECRGIAFDSSGNYYLTGLTGNYGTGGQDAITLKYNAAGIQQWNVTWGGTEIEETNDIAVDEFDNIYVTGATESFGPGESSAFLLKYNSSGDIQWNYTWGGIYDDSGSGIAFDSSGDVYMGGSTASYGPDVPNANWFLAKFDSSGNQIWNYSWGTVEGEWGGSIAVDSSDYIYFIGSTWGHGGPSANVGLIKFNTSGVIEWARYWGIGGYDSPRDIIIDNSDNIYVIAGSDNRGFGGRDIALICYDSSGTLLWDTAWGKTGFDEARAIKLDEQGNIFVTGYTDSFSNGDYDLLNLIFNGSGTLLYENLFNSSEDDVPFDIELNSANKVFVGGYTHGFCTGTGDMLLIKYEIDLTPPLLSILDPTENDFCGVTGPDFELSISEDNIGSSWYTLDDGLINISFSGLTGSIDQTEWENKGNGSISIKFFIRDLAGFEDSSVINLWKDIICPISSIDFVPHSGTTVVNKSTEFILNADDGGGCGVSSIKYRIDYGTWIEYSSPFTLSGEDLGNHQIEFYSVDDLGNEEDIQNVYVQLIKTETDEIPEIGGYSLLVVVALVGIISIMLLRKKAK